VDRADLRLRRVSTGDLTAREIAAIRALLWMAFARHEGGFTEEDWAHSIGGVHIIGERNEEILAHASIVERELVVEDRAILTGYVEAVATHPGHHGRGFGSWVMEAVASEIREAYPLGALSSSRRTFYERLGWKRWIGPTYVRTEHGSVRTPDDDGGVFVLLTPASPPIELTAPISCDWRSGDVW
jgi:aminoglycoside 2'-N-acetyltransferase I